MPNSDCRDTKLLPLLLQLLPNMNSLTAVLMYVSVTHFLSQPGQEVDPSLRVGPQNNCSYGTNPLLETGYEPLC